MTAYIIDAIRTPIGRYGGALAAVRPDDLMALTIAEIVKRSPKLDLAAIDDVYVGCANQSGEDNRNVGRMATLLAGLPVDVPAVTVNRLCGSGMDAVVMAGRAIAAGEGDVFLAGGVESMSRAPFVIGKASKGFGRDQNFYDTTMGWRFINPKLDAEYGSESMPQTGENVAEQYGITRADQDQFSYRSQQKTAKAEQAGFFTGERMIVPVPQRKGDPLLVAKDEHPRPASTLEQMAKLRPIFGDKGTITAGNASGINDGACCLLVASARGIAAQGLKPRAKIIASAHVGLAPAVMGMGPLTASQKALARSGLSLEQMDVIELNEAFASQSLAVMRELGLKDDDSRVNPNGGAIALGHPLGMSGARLITTAINQLEAIGGRYALCTMCIGVGQGIATVLERVEGVDGE